MATLVRIDTLARLDTIVSVGAGTATKAGQAAANVVDRLTGGKVSLRAFVAELFGTALFLFTGLATATTHSGSLDWAANAAAAAAASGDQLAELSAQVGRLEMDVRIHGSWALSTAFAFGIGVTVLAYAVGGISGAHLNPAVTLGQWLTGHMGWINAAAYFVAQLVGAIFATGLLSGMLSDAIGSSLGALQINPGFNAWEAVLGESVMSCILVFTVLQTVNSRNRLDTSMAPLAIGFAVFLGHLALIPVDGACLNPARALGAAIVAGVWPGSFWVFIVGPLWGAVLAALLYWLLNTEALGTTRGGTEAISLDKDAAVARAVARRQSVALARASGEAA